MSNPPPTPPPPTSGAPADDWVPVEQYVELIPHATMFACLYVTDAQGHPLQLHTAKPQHPQAWQYPGGNVEHGQTPFQTAVREMEEEMGLTFRGEPRLLAMHFMLPSTAWPLAKIGVVFDGGVLDAEELAQVRLDPREHSHWQVLPLEQWQPLMGTRYWRRLQASHQARATGTAVYFSEADHTPAHRHEQDGTAAPHTGSGR
ncbi:8-oxo-dGTP diphosphatase [Streptacidiphilus sp. BW17]|uniref:NUDIX domain-containing protein n=1 Tax=Streptacidiphilus sp. BW17 TaxID=3156274 RepID=UPI003511B2A8